MSSISRRPGRWRARYRDDAGKEHARHFKRRVDGQRWLDEVTASVVTGTYVDPRSSAVTVGDYATSWLTGKVHLQPKTRASYESLLRTQVLPQWRDLPLGRVSYEAVTTWVASMAASGVSPSRTRQAYHLMTAMLDDAVKGSRLPRNPAAGVDLPKLPPTERRYLSHEQRDDLAERCGPYRTLVLTLAYTGIRWSEAAGLRVHRIDMLRRRIEVAEAVVDVNGLLVFGTPKNHQARSVPLARFLVDDLAVQLARQDARRTGVHLAARRDAEGS